MGIRKLCERDDRSTHTYTHIHTCTDTYTRKCSQRDISTVLPDCWKVKRIGRNLINPGSVWRMLQMEAESNLASWHSILCVSDGSWDRARAETEDWNRLASLQWPWSWPQPRLWLQTTHLLLQGHSLPPSAHSLTTFTPPHYTEATRVLHLPLCSLT